MTEGLLLRRRRIGPRARAFERVAAVLDLALEVAGRARGAAQIFELVVVRLELVIGDAPVLDRHVLGQKARAVTLRSDASAVMKSVGRKRQVSAFQCRPPPPTPLPSMKAPQLRTGSAVWLALVAEGHRRLRRAQEQLVLDAIAQFVLRVGERKSLAVSRHGPRSIAMTSRPGSVSSWARIEPVQPRPTMTASLRGSLRAI